MIVYRIVSRKIKYILVYQKIFFKILNLLIILFLPFQKDWTAQNKIYTKYEQQTTRQAKQVQVNSLLHYLNKIKQLEWQQK